MKSRSIFSSVLFAAISFALFASCSGDQKQAATEGHEKHEGPDEADNASGTSSADEASARQFQVDQKFQKQLASVFSSYVELKEAFVDSDLKKVQSEAIETEEALAKVDMKLVSGAAHNDWMTYLTPMQNALNKIQSSDEVEAQRKSFSTLSDNLYKSIKAFGSGGAEAFYVYCPMALNDEGAYWLSDQKKIRNPYFGDKMLTCGEVKETLK